ncbi:Monocarboxylate transporter 9, partial [Stegodyphus mimosarum]
MAVQGPDSGYSWAIVLCCSYIHFALFGLFRSAGVMYVALLQTFDVTREEASWPFSLCSAVFQLIGPLVSVLTHYTSQRRACLLGSAIATFGVASCFFAENVLWINIFYGLVHGSGFGVVVTLVPVIINQYFVKYRATAIGIAFSGGTISSFVFPVVMEWMLENYSLNGSFLLLGGVVMNTLVASSLLREPPWIKKPKQTKKALLDDASEAKDSGVSTSADLAADAKMMQRLDNFSSAKSNGEIEISEIIPNGGSKHDDCDSLTDVQLDNELPPAEDKQDESLNLDTIYSNNDSVLFGGSSLKIDTVGNATKYEKYDIPCKNEVEVKDPLLSSNPVFTVPKKDAENFEKKSNMKSNARHSLSEILKEPMFHLITFTMSIFFLGIHSFFMVIVDFAKDKGIPEAQGIYIISMFSLTDLVGRACLGWVTDRNYIKRKNMVILNLIVIGVINQLYPVLNSLQHILVVSAFHGMAVGCTISLFFVLHAEYMGLKRLTLVLGLCSFINGLL